ncbi:MAG: hypothetical protein FVQ84_13205 [Planctomycetes bacterium]|nr:hypothetical protein [Planctomycetota bacterium]
MKMRLARTDWNWITAAIVVSVAVCLVPGQVHAWTYNYRDDFSTNKAEENSYLHSIYWPQGAFPPSEPYLYHSDTDELGFGDLNDDAAILGYRFPVYPAQSPSAVNGYLNIDVRFQDSTDLVSGSLQYSLSDDGVTWSSDRQLGQGSHNISLESVSGVLYVRFRGIEVLIDNLEVFLNSSPATIEVPRDFATIQQAIEAASNGDIVEVSPGTYKGDGNWDIDFKGKTITVRSSSGPGRTTIDCSGNEGHRGFYFHQGETRNSVLRGFTIKGALLPGSEIPSDNSWNSSHPIGGGIYCENSSPSIIDCVITQCGAELGGGIGSVGGSPLIIDCTIERCQAGGFGQAQSGGYGAGIGLTKGSDARIINCIIERNIGYDKSFGAGVYCWQSRLMLSSCDISFNSAQGNVKGGGLYCGGSSAQATLERCIVSNNTAEAGGGTFSDSNARVNIINCTIADNTNSGVHVDASYIAIRNSIVWYNGGSAVSLGGSLSSNPVRYSNIEGYYSGQGNIDSDPKFASRGSDYHLRSNLGRFNSGSWIKDSFSSHSPCIDAGDPQDPIGAEPFPNNKRINMGAYGGTREASKSIGPLIIHVDGIRGSDSHTGLSRDESLRTIQKAVKEAYDGDTIMVWPGTYREAVFVEGKAITIQSADDAAVVMAPSNDYAFTFQFAESSRCVLRNFVITNCDEAAILCHSSSPELTNLTIVNNQFGITAYQGSDPSINNCIFWNNELGDLEQSHARYSCLGALEPGDSNLGNISRDPMFADINNGDYHLQSEYGRYLPKSGTWTTDSQTGPCIDGGDPGVHTGREQKPHGGRVNMGAYGGTPFASKSGPSW